MTITAKTPEGRLRQKAVLTARKAGHPSQWVRDLAHALFAVPSVEGLCLTVLDLPQLKQLVDEVVLRTGGIPGAGRRGVRHATPTAPSGSRVVRMASLAQLHLIEGLCRELHLAEDELAGVIWQATKQRTRAVRTGYQAHVTIEALWAMKERRQHQAAQACQELTDRLAQAAVAGGEP